MIIIITKKLPYSLELGQVLNYLWEGKVVFFARHYLKFRVHCDTQSCRGVIIKPLSSLFHSGSVVVCYCFVRAHSQEALRHRSKTLSFRDLIWNRTGVWTIGSSGHVANKLKVNCQNYKFVHGSIIIDLFQYKIVYLWKCHLSRI